jgi:hypothetical protein
MHGRTFPVFSFFLLTLIAAITLACGSSSSHVLQSINISPATADAQGGQVQFTAIGLFSSSPAKATLTNATWGACDQSGATAGVSVNSSGLAHCLAGAVGTYTVFTVDSIPPSKSVCNVIPACGFTGNACGEIYGAATLTCP